MDLPSVSPADLQSHPAGRHGKQHDRALEAAINQLINLIPATTNNADSNVSELLSALSYYNHKCILASPGSLLEDHFGTALLPPGKTCDFLSRDDLRLSRHGVELIHTWAVPGGSVHVEDSFLWEQPAGWQYRAKNTDARPVCHRMVVLRGLGEQPDNIMVVHCIIFDDEEGPITIPTGSFSLNAKRVTDIMEKSTGLSVQEGNLAVREQLVDDSTKSDAMDGIKETFAIREENLIALEPDLLGAEEDVIGREELDAVCKRKLDLEDMILESRQENAVSYKEFTDERESTLDMAEQATRVYQNCLAFCEDLVAKQEIEVQTAKDAVESHEGAVSMQDEAITASQLEGRAADDAVKARERDISSREKAMAAREQQLKQQEFDIEKVKQDLAIREIQVAEREAKQMTTETSTQSALTEKEKYLCSERIAVASRESALKVIESTLAKHHAEYKSIMSRREKAVSMREGSVSVLEINLKCSQNAFSAKKAEQVAALEACENAVHFREIHVTEREIANGKWEKEQVELEGNFTQRVAAEDARTVTHDVKAKQLLELADTLAKREKEQNRREIGLEKREYDIKLRGEEQLRNAHELMADLEKQAALISLETDGYSLITIPTGSEDVEDENVEDENVEDENGEDADVEDENGEDSEDWENENDEVEPPVKA